MTVHVVHRTLDIRHVSCHVAELHQPVLFGDVAAADVDANLQDVVVVAADCDCRGAQGSTQHAVVEAEQTAQVAVDVDEILPRL